MCRWNQIQNKHTCVMKQLNFSVSTFDLLSLFYFQFNMGLHDWQIIILCFDLHFIQCPNIFGNGATLIVINILIFSLEAMPTYAEVRPRVMP